MIRKDDNCMEENGDILNDELIVKKLRPMSEAPIDKFILAVNSNNEFDRVYFNSERDRWCLEDSNAGYKEEYLKGWIPMPRYEP